MSWLTVHYPKVLVSLAAIFLAYSIWCFFSYREKIEEDFALHLRSPRGKVEILGNKLLKETAVSLERERSIQQQVFDGRKVNLFTGIPLFAKRGALESPVDLLKSEEQHPGIPNQWWLENHIDLTFSDAPSRDPDRDGFTNREEFNAKTDPRLAESYPNPLPKLKVLKVKSRQLHMKPLDYGKGQTVFKLEDRRGRNLNSMPSDKPIESGEVIPFSKPFMKGRFKYKAIEEVNMPSGITEKVWVIEDLSPNKKGMLYRFNKRGDSPDSGQGRPIGSGILDAEVEFILNALGKEQESFVVKENTHFSLPYDSKAKQKDYLLKKVDLENKIIEVIFNEGKKGEIIQKIPFS